MIDLLPARVNREQLLPRLHLALTGVLILGGLVLAGLLVAGKLHFGAAPAPQAGRSADQKAAPSAPEKKPGGRFRVQSVEDAGEAFTAASRRGFLGIPYRELLVFKYQGGFLEAHLLFGTGDRRQDIQTVPAQWAPLLGQARVGEDDDNKEGYLIVAVLDNAPTADYALLPYLPHLFGLLAAGPGGPISLYPWPVVTCNHLRELRLFVVAKPPEGKEGTNFTVSAPGHHTVFRTLFGPTPGGLKVVKLGGGDDLTPGTTFPLVEWGWEDARMEVAARFLTQDEVNRFRSGEGNPSPAPEGKSESR